MQKPASTTPPEADEERDASLRSATSAWWLTGDRPDLLGSIEDTSLDLSHDSEGQQEQPTPQSSWSRASSLTPSPSGGALANSTRPLKTLNNPSNAVWSPERSAFEVSGHATGPLTPQDSYERAENLNEEDFAVAFAKEKAARPWKTGKGISLPTTRPEVAYNSNHAFQNDDMLGPTGRQASAPGTSHGLLAAAPIFEHHRARTQPSTVDSRDLHDWSLANGALEASLEQDSQYQPTLDKATARRGLRSLTTSSVTPLRLDELQDVNAALLAELEQVRGQLAEKEVVNIALSRRVAFLEAKLGIRSAEPLSGQQSMSNASTPVAFNPRANSLLHTSYGDPRAEMLPRSISQSVTPDPFSPFQTSQHSAHQPDQGLFGAHMRQLSKSRQNDAGEVGLGAHAFQQHSRGDSSHSGAFLDTPAQAFSAPQQLAMLEPQARQDLLATPQTPQTPTSPSASFLSGGPPALPSPGRFTNLGQLEHLLTPAAATSKNASPLGALPDWARYGVAGGSDAPSAFLSSSDPSTPHHLGYPTSPLHNQASSPTGPSRFPTPGLPSSIAHFPSMSPMSKMSGGTNAPQRSDAGSQTPERLVSRALSNDRPQEASIQLQQQLKSASAERKAAIISCVKPFALKLSEDKHGNFLVQRAISVDATVCWQLRGHFVHLALSQFGCHVIQRVLDEGEEIKQEVVEELLNDRLMETLTSRNSIHVWQKVLEINWSSAEVRQRMFDAINNVMRGKWAQTARQETGSIVCQNIFESADREEKRECISEILEQLCLCATNQWGVWVVQHILEHGETQDRRTAFNKLLEEAVHLTLSQYGQKAIMTALKCHDADFINAYLDIICDRESAGEGGASSARYNVGASSNYTGSRRSVLVDIASAPQGTQIMHTLLTSVGHEQRDRIIRTVRKNSVFLKGSKAGLKVHQLVERARAFGGY
ncbi:ARM repeat-containing protein [Ceraceosorus guamensis]|uniref:ARM repeat-containing protein n=1 Tax=Ceraceosorus guamensis TaxID=1522189 RepID=A0A316W2K2_9BASI|nr:ARM repeat-containing protein [Ceraceosorus guamensis]PWN44127.1 ARM repeat-containing protein [Ceraceosorus guamensis]